MHRQRWRLPRAAAPAATPAVAESGAAGRTRVTSGPAFVVLGSERRPAMAGLGVFESGAPVRLQTPAATVGVRGTALAFRVAA